MLIAGFQKLTLLDYPEKVAAIVFTAGCVFRCPYCHNPELINLEKNMPLISEQEILGYLKEKKSFLDGVVITGGEPTIHNDLIPFLKRIKKLGLSVKLDTNGARPEMVKTCLEEKLVDYFAMDLKHRWEKYNEIARAPIKRDYENSRITFGLIQSSGVPHEFRTTVLPGWHTEDDLIAMAGYLKPGEKYFLQKTQYANTLEKNLDQSKSIPLAELTHKLQIQFPELTIQER